MDADLRRLELAFAVSLEADCSRRQVGAVIVNESGAVASAGANRAPGGEVGCLAGGCPRATSGVAPGSSYDTGSGTCISVHAEQWALLRASWEDQIDGVLYCTDEPCDGCRRMLRASPLKAWVTPAGTTLNRPTTKEPK
jgi:dCMP deaminase